MLIWDEKMNKKFGTYEHASILKLQINYIFIFFSRDGSSMISIH